MKNNQSEKELWCDKHHEAGVHRPMYMSLDRKTKRPTGWYFCPNVESVDEVGNKTYCKFLIAPSYNPPQRFAIPNGSLADSTEGADAELMV